MHFKFAPVILLVLPLLFVSGCSKSQTTTLAASPVSAAPALPVAQANPTPALTSVSPSAFTLDAAAENVAVTGTGFTASLTATISGQSRAVVYISASQIQVGLTSADLARPGLDSVVVTNPAPGGGASNALSVAVSSERAFDATAYDALGDSITAGYLLTTPLTQAYPYLVGALLNVPVSDYGNPGDESCDVFTDQVYAQKQGFTTAQPGYSLLIGTNDANNRGAGAYEAEFNACHQALIAWLGTPRAHKLLPGDKQITTTGACPDSADTTFGSMDCTGAGTISASGFATYGKPLYIWYVLDDEAGSNDTFSVKIDGAQVATVTTLPATTISTRHGAHAGVALERIATNAGNHTVLLSSSGNVKVVGIGTSPNSITAVPMVAVGDIPNQLAGHLETPLATQLSYSADIQANVSELMGDGLDIRFVPDRTYMLGTAAEMTDDLHPNVLGHQEIAHAFEDTFSGKPVQ